MPEITPHARASRCAEIMHINDHASKWLGVSIDEVTPGQAVASMQVQAHHLNGHGICHGGFIFTLADTAFAYACNSHNEVVVAQHNTISFIAPAKLGEQLTARATETSKSGRNGIYDVIVSGENDRQIAAFRGCSRIIRGHHFDEKDQ
jgi:acyl-CoA thioesterase